MSIKGETVEERKAEVLIKLRKYKLIKKEKHEGAFAYIIDIPEDKQKARQARQDARADAWKMVEAFNKQFGAICCRDLIKLDLSKPEESKRLAEISKDKCDKFVAFVIGKLYDFAEKKS